MFLCSLESPDWWELGFMTHFEALLFGLPGTEEISGCWGPMCVQKFPALT